MIKIVIILVIIIVIIFLYTGKIEYKEHFTNFDSYDFFINRNFMIKIPNTNISIGILKGNQNNDNAYLPSNHNQNNPFYKNSYIYAIDRNKYSNNVGFEPSWKIVSYQNNKDNLYLIYSEKTNSYLTCNSFHNQSKVVFLQNEKDENSVWIFNFIENGIYTIKHQITGQYLYCIENIDQYNFVSNVYDTPFENSQFKNKPDYLKYQELSIRNEPYQFQVCPTGFSYISNGTDRIWVNQGMSAGQYLKSKNGIYTCTFQSNGNLCVTKNGKYYYCLASISFNGYQNLVNNGSVSNSKLNFQPDTNVCINKNGRNIWCLGNPYWQSTINEIYKKYGGHVPCKQAYNTYIILENDGNLVIYYNNKKIWYMFNYFTPSNSHGICSDSNVCSGPGGCRGKYQNVDNGGCNHYCPGKGNYYRSDLGVCIKDFSAIPTANACTNLGFIRRNNGYRKCVKAGFLPELCKENSNNFRCVPGFTTPLACGGNGRIKCASRDGRNCLWGSCSIYGGLWPYGDQFPNWYGGSGGRPFSVPCLGWISGPNGGGPYGNLSACYAASGTINNCDLKRTNNCGLECNKKSCLQSGGKFRVLNSNTYRCYFPHGNVRCPKGISNSSKSKSNYSKIPGLIATTYIDYKTPGGPWALIAYGSQGNIGRRLDQNGGDFTQERKGNFVLDSRTLLQKNGKMIIAWNRFGYPTEGIDSYEYAIEFSLVPGEINLNGKTGGPGNGPGVGPGPGSFSWRNNNMKGQPLNIKVLKGNPQLPNVMYTRNDSFGVNYGNSYGLVNNIARTNPQLDWGVDGQPFETLYISYGNNKNYSGYGNKNGYLSVNGGRDRYTPSTISIWVSAQ